MQAPLSRCKFGDLALVNILSKIRFSMVFAAVLWPTEEKARRKTYYWQSNSDSKLGAYQRTTIISDMDRAQESGKGKKKKNTAKQHSTAKQSHARCKPPKQPPTGNRASKKTKTAFPPGRVTAVVKKNTNPDGSPRGHLHLFLPELPCSQVPACPPAPRSASNFLYMYVTL